MKSYSLGKGILCLLFLVVGSLCSPNTAFLQQKGEMIPRIKDAAARAFLSVERFEIDENKNVPYSVRGRLAVDVNLSDVSEVRQILKKSSAVFRIDTTTDDFLQKQITRDDLGMTHARVQQTYKGIPVYGGELILHSDAANTLKEINGKFVPGLNLDVSAWISGEQALQTALQDLRPATYRWLNSEQERVLKEVLNDENATWLPKPLLMIAPRNGDFEKGEYRLVWKMTIAIDGEKLGNYEYFIDAKTGEVINKFNSMPNDDAIGTGTSNYNGTVSFHTNTIVGGYEMYNILRNIKTYTANNGTSLPGTLLTDSDNTWDATAQRSAVDAHWAAEAVRDFYLVVFNRNSFDNTGAQVRSTVHYGSNYNNAFWNGAQLVFGDGDGVTFSSLTSIDVCGHEFAHAVTQYTAGLIYQGESGALNEAFSDVFGTNVEFYATPAKANWLIGEECYTPGTGGDALRYMNNPNLGGQPDTYDGTHWFSQTGCVPSQSNDYCGVHTNSGVLNYAYYLMSQGGSGTNDIGTSFNITGIGITTTRSIAYRALTVYLTSGSNYASARTAFLSAAADLYPDVSGQRSQEYVATGDAFVAVGIGVKLIAKNNFTSGTIKINGLSASSGYVFFAAVGGSQTLEAIPQQFQTYDRVWNTSGNGLSNWQKQPQGGQPAPIQGATNVIYTFNPVLGDNNATYIADLKKRYNVYRNDLTDFDGTVSAGIVAQIVELNSGVVSAPAQQTINSRDYRFYQWSDGVLASSRTVAPIDNMTLTAQYKAHLASSSSAATAPNNQREVSQVGWLLSSGLPERRPHMVCKIH